MLENKEINRHLEPLLNLSSSQQQPQQQSKQSKKETIIREVLHDSNLLEVRQDDKELIVRRYNNQPFTLADLPPLPPPPRVVLKDDDFESILELLRHHPEAERKMGINNIFFSFSFHSFLISVFN